MPDHEPGEDHELSILDPESREGALLKFIDLLLFICRPVFIYKCLSKPLFLAEPSQDPGRIEDSTTEILGPHSITNAGMRTIYFI